MKKSQLASLLFIGLQLFLWNHFSWGQVPPTMSYQGILSNVDGTLVPDASYTLNFKLYEVPDGGEAIWEESQNVDVNKGIFNVILGNIHPLDLPFNVQYWLGVAIGTNVEFLPRIPLTSSAYSLSSRSVGDHAITDTKIMDGVVVRSINSLADHVVLEGGENISISHEDNRLIISSSVSVTDNAWIVSDNNVFTAVPGNVGIGTTVPSEKLEIGSGNLLVKGPENFTGIEDTASLYLGDANHYIQSIFNRGLRLGTFNVPNGIFLEQESGRVGIGTMDPTAELHVMGGVRIGEDSKNIVMFTQGTGEDISSTNTLHLNYNNNQDVSIGEGATSDLFVSGGIRIGEESKNIMMFTQGTGEDISSTNTLHLNYNNNQDVSIGEGASSNLYVSGRIGIGLENPQGSLDVNGAIYQRGSLLHADYVFEEDYKLESIEQHSEYMWANKHLRAIPKASLDSEGSEIVEFGAHQKGIVEELEKAHIYIEQLLNRIKELEQKVELLETHYE